MKSTKQVWKYLVKFTENMKSKNYYLTTLFTLDRLF